jgi:hypothetical protein
VARGQIGEAGELVENPAQDGDVHALGCFPPLTVRQTATTGPAIRISVRSPSASIRGSFRYGAHYTRMTIFLYSLFSAKAEGGKQKVVFSWDFL